MGEYFLFPMKNTELYPVYRSYVRMIKMAILLFLPLSAGIAYLTWCGCERSDVTALVLFVCMAFLVIISLLKNCFLKCPYCGKYTVTIRAEACSVVSTAWSMAPFTAHCRYCGKNMRTDLALKSNIFLNRYRLRLLLSSWRKCGTIRSECFLPSED